MVATAVVRDEVRVPGTGPVAFGSMAYAAESAAGATLVVPEVIVGCRDGRWWLTTIGTKASVPAPAAPAARSRRRSPSG